MRKLLRATSKVWFWPNYCPDWQLLPAAVFCNELITFTAHLFNNANNSNWQYLPSSAFQIDLSQEFSSHWICWWNSNCKNMLFSWGCWEPNCSCDRDGSKRLLGLGFLTLLREAKNPIVKLCVRFPTFIKYGRNFSNAHPFPIFYQRLSFFDDYHLWDTWSAFSVKISILSW